MRNIPLRGLGRAKGVTYEQVAGGEGEQLRADLRRSTSRRRPVRPAAEPGDAGDAARRDRGARRLLNQPPYSSSRARLISIQMLLSSALSHQGFPPSSVRALISSTAFGMLASGPPSPTLPSGMHIEHLAAPERAWLWDLRAAAPVRVDRSRSNL